MMTTINESAVRSRARRAGYIVRKSRRAESLDNFGDFRLVDASLNGVVLGSRFDATLDEIHEFLSDGSGRSE
jgi:hypothetical protein